MDLKSYFALSDDPFRLTPDETFFFPTRGHVAVREVVRHTIEMGEGIVVVVGEPGTGKTLLLRMLLKEVEDRETVLVVTPAVSPEDLLRIIIQDLTGQGPRAGNKALLLQELFGHIEQLAAQGRGLLIAIDEAQHTPPETLEQLRLITNFETAQRKIVQLLLVGQPELREVLETPLLRPFAQRISVVEHMTPLSRPEMEEYIDFRLKRAGGGRVEFTPKALDAIHRASGGVPRVVNKIAARALFLAYANKTRRIGPELIEAAVSTMELSSGPRPVDEDAARGRGRWWKVAAGMALAALVGAGGAYLAGTGGDFVLKRLPVFAGRSPALTNEPDARPAEAPRVRVESPTGVANFPADSGPHTPATGEWGRVRLALVHVRKGPGTGFAHVCYVGMGDRVEILERRSNWYRIRHEVEGYASCTGWIAASTIALEKHRPEATGEQGSAK